MFRKVTIKSCFATSFLVLPDANNIGIIRLSNVILPLQFDAVDLSILTLGIVPEADLCGAVAERSQSLINAFVAGVLLIYI